MDYKGVSRFQISLAPIPWLWRKGSLGGPDAKSNQCLSNLLCPLMNVITTTALSITDAKNKYGCCEKFLFCQRYSSTYHYHISPNHQNLLLLSDSLTFSCYLVRDLWSDHYHISSSFRSIFSIPEINFSLFNGTLHLLQSLVWNFVCKLGVTKNNLEESFNNFLLSFVSSYARAVVTIIGAK